METHAAATQEVEEQLEVSEASWSAHDEPSEVLNSPEQASETSERTVALCQLELGSLALCATCPFAMGCAKGIREATAQAQQDCDEQEADTKFSESDMLSTPIADADGDIFGTVFVNEETTGNDTRRDMYKLRDDAVKPAVTPVTPLLNKRPEAPRTPDTVTVRVETKSATRSYLDILMDDSVAIVVGSFAPTKEPTPPLPHGDTHEDAPVQKPQADEPEEPAAAAVPRRRRHALVSSPVATIVAAKKSQQEEIAPPRIQRPVNRRRVPQTPAAPVSVSVPVVATTTNRMSAVEVPKIAPVYEARPAQRGAFAAVAATPLVVEKPDLSDAKPRRTVPSPTRHRKPSWHFELAKALDPPEKNEPVVSTLQPRLLQKVKKMSVHRKKLTNNENGEKTTQKMAPTRRTDALADIVVEAPRIVMPTDAARTEPSLPISRDEHPLILSSEIPDDTIDTLCGEDGDGAYQENARGAVDDISMSHNGYWDEDDTVAVLSDALKRLEHAPVAAHTHAVSVHARDAAVQGVPFVLFARNSLLKIVTVLAGGASANSGVGAETV